MMKEWFIQIDGSSQGPYSIEDLKRDDRITPDTLVWKEGFANWVPMRKVAELEEVFRDVEENPSSEEEEEEENKPKKPARKDLAGGK